MATPAATTAAPERAWRGILTREEIAELVEVNDARAWLSIAIDWGIVALAFAIVAIAPNPITVVLALCLIGGRQLGFSVVMHEAAHRTLLRDRRWNDFVGRWLGAHPVWSSLDAYRPYHLRHHAKNWTAEDPDLGLATPFPVTRASMRRKIWRDLSGQTGWKRARATLRRDLAMHGSGLFAKDSDEINPLYGMVIANAALLGILTAFGHPALYLLWVGAWFTTYSLIMRIRSIAEHAMVSDPNDDLQNTRTTEVSWWERLFLAPNRVNYHLEHHLLMTVPHHNLPRLHRMLRERGVLEKANVVRGYREVLRLASSRRDDDANITRPEPVTVPPF